MKVLIVFMAVFVAVVLGGSCTPAAKSRGPVPGGQRTAREGSEQKKALFPRVMHEMPPGGVLDLGPVVVTGRAGGLETMAILQDVAERIGADAFVLEEKKEGEAYPVKSKAVGGFLETFDGRIYQVSIYVVRPAAEDGSVKETGFYRAVRLVEGEPGPCRLDDEKLTGDVQALFEGVTTLREQIRRLTVLFTKGIIDAETFRLVRKSCLEQLR